MLVLLASFVPFVADAATATGKTGEIITLRIDDYSSTGSKIYNDLLSGNMYARSYTWTSSNERVTTWSTKANTFAYVKFSEPGTYTVNFDLDYSFSGASRSYKFSATWTVTVQSSGPTGISVSASRQTIKVGESTTVTASVYGGSGSVSWKKSNSNVSIYDNGTTCTVTGVSSGTSRITATTSNGHSDYVNITVVEPNTISLSPSSLELTVGETGTVYAEISGNNSSSCSWSSSDQSVVKVNSSGKTAEITAVGAGNATVTAKAYDGTTATCRVTVKEQPLQDIYVVGALTGWNFLDDFKFSTTDNGKTYTLYLDYLGGEFKIASTDWSIGLGSTTSFVPGKTIKVNPNGNNMRTLTGYEHLKLVYTPSDNTLKADYGYRPISSSAKKYWVWFRTSTDGGFIGLDVIEGSRVPFTLGVLDGWNTKTWIIDDETYDGMLYDKENRMYITPQIMSNCTIGVTFENTSNGISSAALANRANLIMTKDGVQITDIAEDITIEMTDLKGISRIIVPKSDSVDIILAPNNVYVIGLSNGQTFKVLK